MANLITLDRLHELLRYDPETGKFTNKVRRAPHVPAGSVCGCAKNDSGYVITRIDGRFYYLHRLAWFMVHGAWPSDDLEVDHINGDKSDQRISNLRLVTRSQNKANRPKGARNQSGVVGVSFNPVRGLWAARLNIEGECVLHEYFETKEQAIEARKTAEIVWFGEYRWGAHSCV